MREQDFIAIRIKQSEAARRRLDESKAKFRHHGGDHDSSFLSPDGKPQPIRITRRLLVGMRKVILSMDKDIVGGEWPF